MSGGLLYMMILIMNLLGVLVPILLAVALLTLLERKVLGYMQFRKGPNLVGPLGLLQPMADGLKLFIKENFKPSSASPFLFFLSPIVFFFISLILWGMIPLVQSGLKFKLSLLFIMTMSSLSVYSMLSAGWASNSKYALLGSIRGVAQTISYEVSFGLILLPLVLVVGSWGLCSFYKLQETAFWLIFPCFPLFMMWFITTLAETNRSPFDLTEGESELVSGYNVEYSGAPFALFFMGEYAKIMLMNLLSVILFLGVGSPFTSFFFCCLTMSMKTFFLIFLFLWIRASFPRIRYDQLMMVMWKGFLPLSISYLLFIFLFVILLNGIPSYYS